MIAVRHPPMTMFQTSPMTDTSRSHHGHYDRPMNSTDRPSLPPFGSSSRPHIELPHPLEPRAQQHHPQYASEHGSPIEPRRHEPYRIATSTAPALPRHGGLSDSRHAPPSLPGLRDILTPESTPSSGPHKFSLWNSNGAQSSTQLPPSSTQQSLPHIPTSTSVRSNSTFEGYPAQSVSHPPAALQPLPDSGMNHHSRADRRLDGPILEQSPPGRYPPQTVPISPYHTYPDNRDGVVTRTDRPRQSSSVFHSASVASPHSVSTHDESQSVGYIYDRPRSDSEQTNAENQRKYVGIKDIPGEGSFHVYEGGYRIPTHVDGEQVNPAWGLTKANKPRKRLALACLDCREKKIKCEPGAVSCVQCEKAKRPCRRALVQLPTTEINGPAPSWPSNVPSPPSYQCAPGPSPNHSHREVEVENTHKRRAREYRSPPRLPAKKQRSISPAAMAVAPGNANQYRHHESVEPSMAHSTGPRSRLLDREVRLERDPYSIDPGATRYLAGLYFTHLNGVICDIFPRSSFMDWLVTRPDKTVEENMVLYALLAAASIFADENSVEFGQLCGEVAAQAVSNRLGHCCLVDVQTRILLGVYNCSKGNLETAWHYYGAAIRVAMSASLRLNTEKGCIAEPDSLKLGSRPLFLLSPDQLNECRRRTFWSLYLTDRLAGGTHCAINVQDVFTRLPGANDLYEHGHPSHAPLFVACFDDIATRSDTVEQLSPNAWLVLVATIWGDVLEFLHRAPHKSDASYREAYESFHRRAHERLRHMFDRLPERLRYTDSNLERSMREGYANSFVTLHALHHYSLMKLNRCIRHRVMLDVVGRNIRLANQHAHSLLAYMCTLRSINREIMTRYGRAPDFIFSTPAPSCMILSAIDIVGAGGLESSLGKTMDAIHGGLDVLREQSSYWKQASDELGDCQKRYYQIQNILSRPTKAKGGCWLGREWGLEEPVKKELDIEEDCIYGVTEPEGKPYAIYFDALKDTQLEHNHLRAGMRGA